MPPLRRLLSTAWIFALITSRLVLPPIISGVLLATLMWFLGLFQLPAFVLIAGFPLIYMVWLYLFLLTCCTETLLITCLVRKPETCTHHATGVSMMSLVLLSQYGRNVLIRSLPYARLLVGANLLRTLVLRAYSPASHLAPTCQLSTIIADPDCTYIGDKTIVGGNVELVAHSFVRLLDGTAIYKSAPIRIGKNVTIGGDARIGLGVTVGDGALVEPSSNVRPYTNIGAGEIWGGNPAAFMRHRESASKPDVATPAAQPDTAAAGSVLPIIALALGVPPEKLTSESKMEEVLEWDSLGKIAIAAALHDRFGLELEPDQIFELDSVAHVLRFLEAGKKPVSSSEPENRKDALPRNMELLPLGDFAATTTSLAGHPLPEPFKELRLCISATTVAESVTPTLQLWCRAFGIKADLVFAGFDQVHACLLQADSIFYKNRTGLNVAIVCAEDLSGSAEGDLTTRALQLLEAIESFAQKSAQPLWVTDLPPLLKPDQAISAKELSSVRALWSERLAANAKVRLLPLASIIEELGLNASANPAGVTNVRYNAAVYQRLAIEISRAARVFHIPPRKVLALDADDTLWEGIVAEDGPANIKVGPLQRQLQRHAQAFKEKGGLLVMLSRNEAEDVWAVWEHQKDMILQRDDFVAVRINWKAKSDNLREVAGELNLGLDSFVFVDDNPGERIDVESRCPGVLAVPSPVPGEGADLVGRLWCFDTLATTAEDTERTVLIQQEAQRREAATGSEGDYTRYLQSLDLQVSIRRAQPADIPRVAQLTQKTNQFNISLRRRNEGELGQLGSDHEIWTLSARDRFGDYGMIGVGILQRDPNDSCQVILDSFMISCRALGRGIESASLSFLCETASQTGASRLRIPFVRGPRNQPVLAFLEQQGWKTAGPDVGEFSLPARLPVPAHLKLTIA